jgi:hypothetical protein
MPNDDAKADPKITVTDDLDPTDVAVITDGLGTYDFSQIGYLDFRRFAVFVQDPQTGKSRRRALRRGAAACRISRLGGTTLRRSFTTNAYSPDMQVGPSSSPGSAATPMPPSARNRAIRLLGP